MVPMEETSFRFELFDFYEFIYIFYNTIVHIHGQLFVVRFLACSLLISMVTIVLFV